MHSLPNYCVYLLLLAIGLLGLRRLARADRLAAWQGARGRAAACVLAALMFAISEPQHAFEDFLEAYYAAGAAILAGEIQASQLFAHGVFGFVNNPIVAFVFVPFALLPPGLAALVYAALGVAAAVVSWRVLVSAAGLDLPRAALLALLFVLNGPLMNSLREGNSSQFALLALVLAFVSLRRQREWRAGCLLGAAALLKLPLLLFGVYFALRGRWRAVAAGGLVVAGAGLLSIAVFGSEVQRVWYQQFVAAAGSHPIAAFNVQSIAAFAARWQQEGATVCDWNGRPLLGSARAASALATAFLYAAVLGCALAPRRRVGSAALPAPGPQELELEFLLVVVLACLTSPVAWTHYYAWLLVPIAFLLAPASPLVDGRWTRLLAGTAVLLVAAPVVFPDCAPSGPLARPYVVLLSHYLFGGLLLLGLLLRQRLRLRLESHAPTS